MYEKIKVGLKFRLQTNYTIRYNGDKKHTQNNTNLDVLSILGQFKSTLEGSFVWGISSKFRMKHHWGDWSSNTLTMSGIGYDKHYTFCWRHQCSRIILIINSVKFLCIVFIYTTYTLLYRRGQTQADKSAKIDLIDIDLSNVLRFVSQPNFQQ